VEEELAVAVNPVGTLGGTTGFTVSVAGLLVTLPTEFVTATVNCEPLSALVVAGVVYVEEVAPEIAAPLFFH
jgi:hypothetical protein